MNSFKSKKIQRLTESQQPKNSMFQVYLDKIEEALKTGKLTEAKKQYLGQCDKVRNSDENEIKWHQMMKNKKGISFSDFIKNVDMSSLLDEDETPLDFLEFNKSQDRSSQTYKSNWGSKEAMFFQTAGFEYIFV